MSRGSRVINALKCPKEVKILKALCLADRNGNSL